ncbi:decaprenyl-phosphate phosphoribosyltransferase [Paenibacillus sonchi]|uniref:Decaprenyl-phosphate phosphoribosyltransferase n=1 Tax=Paenibacillus sonchi TaxID=373687 RepID=A0A974SGY3_9BACL|nr:decaprenyl-phosphate phosphoribosyltransferase [Paenibacillus sonchi]QQZ64030.1 decaprenyl-phosphate phosphoribosyltransferase [Paenibacillus sonchi]
MLNTNVVQRNNILLIFLEQMRWKQWTKNFLVFAALIFSINKIDGSIVINSFLGFICFCLVSSCVYILNDYLDLESDKLHPRKKFRPMASGQLNPRLTIIIAFIILVICGTLAFYLDFLFGIVILGYFILNVAYSLKLKHMVILDVMTIATGFVLRAIGGALVIKVYLTPWFLICIMLLALFLAVNKRRHELLLLDSDSSHHRKVLQSYSLPLIDQMNNIVTSATIVSYALFTFTAGRTVHLMWTIPLVIYGIFRYLYLIYVKNEGGAPDKLLFTDKPILITVVLYAILTIVVLSVFE